MKISLKNLFYWQKVQIKGKQTQNSLKFCKSYILEPAVTMRAGRTKYLDKLESLIQFQYWSDFIDKRLKLKEKTASQLCFIEKRCFTDTKVARKM